MTVGELISKLKDFDLTTEVGYECWEDAWNDYVIQEAHQVVLKEGMAVIR